VRLREPISACVRLENCGVGLDLGARNWVNECNGDITPRIRNIRKGSSINKAGSLSEGQTTGFVTGSAFSMRTSPCGLEHSGSHSKLLGPSRVGASVNQGAIFRKASTEPAALALAGASATRAPQRLAFAKCRGEIRWITLWRSITCFCVSLAFRVGGTPTNRWNYGAINGEKSAAPVTLLRDRNHRTGWSLCVLSLVFSIFILATKVFEVSLKTPRRGQ